MLALYEAPDTNVLPARACRLPLLKYSLGFLSPLLFCLVSCTTWIAAQEIETDEVVRVRTDLVTVPVVVTDSRGHRVFGLSVIDFLIRAKGRAQKIEFFSTGTSQVTLVFLLDASGSARAFMRDQREAALSLFSRFGPQSQISVLQFSDRVSIAVPFSVDIAKAGSGFDFPVVSERPTAIFDAAMAALKLLRERNPEPTERQIVILTSDGLDTASTLKATEVIERARREAVSFYIIHFPMFTPREGRLLPRRAASGFRDLAEKTGGRYFVAGDARAALADTQKDLSPVFKAIEEDLAGQYLLGFYSDQASRDILRYQPAVSLSKKGRGYRLKTLREGYTPTQ